MFLCHVLYERLIKHYKIKENITEELKEKRSNEMGLGNELWLKLC